MRTICVFTGTRADWWLLRRLCHLLDGHPEFNLKVLASGTHLSELHGHTLADITAEFTNVIPIDIGVSHIQSVSELVAKGLTRYSRALSELNPDLCLVLGDRFEALAFSQAALFCQIPLIHCHGGESTLGAVDDQIRHAITKLAQIHFVSTDVHRTRVIQMGEQPNRVFNVGAFGLDNVETLIDTDLACDPFSGAPFCLATFHAETLKPDHGLMMIRACLESLLRHRIKTLITGTNADSGSEQIRDLIESFVTQYADNFVYRENLGAAGYLSTMQNAQFVFGNSSSGILETPSVGVPTINVGDRQTGRPRAPSVIDVFEVTAPALDQAFANVLGHAMQDAAKRKISPYGTPGVSQRALDHLINLPHPLPLMKPFYGPSA